MWMATNICFVLVRYRWWRCLSRCMVVLELTFLCVAISFQQLVSLTPQCFRISCFIFFFSAVIFNQHSVAGHSKLVKRVMDPTGLEPRSFSSGPFLVFGRLCCLPVDRALAGSRHLTALSLLRKGLFKVNCNHFLPLLSIYNMTLS